MQINYVPIVVPERNVTITMTEREARLLALYLGTCSSREFANRVNFSIRDSGAQMRQITDASEESDIPSEFDNLVYDLEPS